MNKVGQLGNQTVLNGYDTVRHFLLTGASNTLRVWAAKTCPVGINYYDAVSWKTVREAIESQFGSGTPGTIGGSLKEYYMAMSESTLRAFEREVLKDSRLTIERKNKK